MTEPPRAPGEGNADGYEPPPAYQPPPAYGPPSGYGPPTGGYGPPVGYADSEERAWALVAHLGGIVAGFVAPLVALLAKGDQSPTVRAHAVEALNFQITWGAATLVASLLMACTFGLLFILPLSTLTIATIFAIIGGVKAAEGQLYRYPLCFRVVT